MNKIAIIYHSEHHGNTKKLLDAIPNKDIVDIISLPANEKIDLSEYETIGFASGIYMAKMHQSLFDYVNTLDSLKNKNSFIVFTSGTDKSKYSDSFKELLLKKQANIIGIYHCSGYDTYGPWKLVGGLAKNHPNNEDIEEFISFYKKVIK